MIYVKEELMFPRIGKFLSCTQEFLRTAPIRPSQKCLILTMLVIGNFLITITYAWDKLMNVITKPTVQP